jgi:hypothetical protein
LVPCEIILLMHSLNHFGILVNPLIVPLELFYEERVNFITFMVKPSEPFLNLAVERYVGKIIQLRMSQLVPLLAMDLKLT